MPNTKRQEDLPCIYCRTNDHPKTKEHVLAKSLGGNLTIPFVCKECNRVLSTVDQALAERSFVSLTRAATTPAEWFETKLGSNVVVEHNGLLLDCEIANGFRTEILPQIHIRLPPPADATPIEIYVATIDARAKFFALIEKRIADSTFKNTPVRITPSDEMKSIRLVHYESKHMLVRAASEGQGRRFLEALENAWPRYRAQADAQAPGASDVHGTIEHPTAHVRSTYCPDDYLRAIAKTSFNYLAFARGAEFALHTELDPLRDYVVGRSIQHDPSLGPEDLHVDTRFVISPDGSAPFFVRTDYHVLGLFYDAPTLWGFATFYGQHAFLIRLGDLEIHENVVHVHEFVGDRISNRVLDHRDIVERIQSVNPSQLVRMHGNR